jgi:hypothetical protein
MPFGSSLLIRRICTGCLLGPDIVTQISRDEVPLLFPFPEDIDDHFLNDFGNKQLTALQSATPAFLRPSLDPWNKRLKLNKLKEKIEIPPEYRRL